MTMAAESFDAVPNPIDAIGASVMAAVSEVLNETLAEAKRQGAWEEALMRRQFDRDMDSWNRAVPLEVADTRIRAAGSP
jgi:hypothetical protein